MEEPGNVAGWAFGLRGLRVSATVFPGPVFIAIFLYNQALKSLFFYRYGASEIAKISCREYVSRVQFAKFSCREIKVIYSMIVSHEIKSLY